MTNVGLRARRLCELKAIRRVRMLAVTPKYTTVFRALRLGAPQAHRTDDGAFAGATTEIRPAGIIDATAASRAVRLAYKAVRHVRTPGGAEHFGQPIGSVIVRDRPLRNLRVVDPVWDDFDLVEGSDGSRYDVGQDRGRWYATAHGNWDEVIVEGSSADDVYEKLDTYVGSAGRATYPGMYAASEADRTAFKETVGRPIPPAWTDVWIAADPGSARVLVRGRDSKGRVQTIYSAAHSTSQAEKKFARIKELAKHLDKLDAAMERDAIDNDDAAALLLIRRLGMRPGSDRATGAEKQAHGATNLRAKHVKVTPGGQVNFDFVGKKGVHIQLKVKDPLIAEVIRQRLETRSRDQPLFDTDERRTRAYMRSTGVPEDFLLKDLRTVHANYVALREIAKRKDAVPQTKAEFRRWRREVAVAVSAELGNTPTLALMAYINPVVFARWLVDESWD